MKRYLLSILLAALGLCTSMAQTMMRYDEYMSLVLEHHPVVKNAGIQAAYSDAARLSAKGGFDPKFETYINAKNYDGKNYYRLFSSGLKVPTWYGIELKAYYDRNNGTFLNDEERLPSNGLFTAGLSFPLARGFVLDERRYELKKADIFSQSQDERRRLLLNDLYFDAAVAYLEWQQAYGLYAIAAEGLALANRRLSDTKGSFALGDKPAIDTLEVYIVKLNREQELLDAAQNLQNARLQVNNYLWLEGMTPIEMEDNLRPDTMLSTQMAARVDSINLNGNWHLNHPDINTYQLKIDQLALDNRLNREMLKPDIRVNFNPLVTANDNYLPTGYSPNDYKLGASVYFPLFFRKERGKVKSTELKIQESKTDLVFKTQTLKTKFAQYTNNADFYRQQLSILRSNVANYRQMLDAENRLFNLGESSVFLVNSREVKYLEAQIKAIDYTAKLLKSRYAALYTSGTLF